MEQIKRNIERRRFILFRKKQIVQRKEFDQHEKFFLQLKIFLDFLGGRALFLERGVTVNPLEKLRKDFFNALLMPAEKNKPACDAAYAVIDCLGDFHEGRAVGAPQFGGGVVDEFDEIHELILRLHAFGVHFEVVKPVVDCAYAVPECTEQKHLLFREKLIFLVGENFTRLEFLADGIKHLTHFSKNLSVFHSELVYEFVSSGRQLVYSLPITHGRGVGIIDSVFAEESRYVHSGRQLRRVSLVCFFADAAKTSVFNELVARDYRLGVNVAGSVVYGFDIGGGLNYGRAALLFGLERRIGVALVGLEAAFAAPFLAFAAALRGCLFGLNVGGSFGRGLFDFSRCRLRRRRRRFGGGFRFGRRGELCLEHVVSLVAYRAQAIADLNALPRQEFDNFFFVAREFFCDLIDSLCCQNVSHSQ